jgi:broad specificity phosphatase PhoE
MTAHLYLSHPEVTIDPAIPVPEWSLSAIGRQRLFVETRKAWWRRFGRIVSSTETKAVESARLIGQAIGITPEVGADMHENDRSATGYLPKEEFEQVADAFFADPGTSVRGWERAIDAQERIVRAVLATASIRPSVPTLFVGHGGVGTLLMCHCLRHAITRDWDQLPGGGNHFAFDPLQPRVFYTWRAMEAAPGGLPT